MNALFLQDFSHQTILPTPPPPTKIEIPVEPKQGLGILPALRGLTAFS
jgi:hypothetical protein